MNEYIFNAFSATFLNRAKFEQNTPFFKFDRDQFDL